MFDIVFALSDHIDCVKAEWLGNDNRKTMIKVKTIGQMLPFKNGTALPSPSQAPGSQFFPFLNFIHFYLYHRSNIALACQRLLHFVFFLIVTFIAQSPPILALAQNRPIFPLALMPRLNSI